MAHPLIHSKSSVKKYGGKVEDYTHIHEWFDETKSWYGHSYHRLWRHHSEGIFECEKNSVNHLKIVMVRPFILDMLVKITLKKIVLIIYHQQRNG